MVGAEAGATGAPHGRDPCAPGPVLLRGLLGWVEPPRAPAMYLGDSSQVWCFRAPRRTGFDASGARAVVSGASFSRIRQSANVPGLLWPTFANFANVPGLLLAYFTFGSWAAWCCPSGATLLAGSLAGRTIHRSWAGACEVLFPSNKEPICSEIAVPSWSPPPSFSPLCGRVGERAPRILRKRVMRSSMLSRVSP